MALLPSLIGSKMRLWEGYLVRLLSFKGLDFLDESPFNKGWVSAPPVCPPDETCNPESMVGTMTPLEGSLPPF